MDKNKMKLWYDEELDVLYISFKKGVAIDSKELEEGVKVEYGGRGEIMGVEVLGVSRLLAPMLKRRIEESISQSLVH
ncbi:MAG: DUF2283 domain-containing protein [bacterium]